MKEKSIKILLSLALTGSLFLSLISYFILSSYNFSIFFIVIFLATCLFSLFYFKKDLKSKQKIKLIILGLFAISFIFLLSYFSKSESLQNNNLSNSQNTNYQVDKKKLENIDSVKSKRDEKEKESVENMLQDLQIKIQNKESQENILLYVQNIIAKANSNLNKDNTKSYLDLAKVYEAAYVINTLKDKNYALDTYYEYCRLEPNDPECYASIARFMIADRDNYTENAKEKDSINNPKKISNKTKDEILKFANKALTLARSEKEIDVYNSLVEYIIKL